MVRRVSACLSLTECVDVPIMRCAHWSRTILASHVLWDVAETRALQILEGSRGRGRRDKTDVMVHAKLGIYPLGALGCEAPPSAGNTNTPATIRTFDY